MPDVKGYKLPNHDETYMYADAKVRDAGWGEGKPHASIDANTANTTCVFASAKNTPTNEHTWLCEFYATSNDGSGSWGHMIATCQDIGVMEGCVCKRLKRDGVWSDWEWENPPMALGVEYRTTERCLGKAVYRQVVNFGALPNATSKAVAHGISGISLVTEAEILNMGGSSSLTDYVGIAGVYGDGINVTIHTNLNSLSGVNVYVALKYIKD